MVTLAAGDASASILAALSTPANSSPASISAFSEQLATALETYLNGSSGNGSQIEIDIAATPGQDPGVRQFTVTLKDPIAAAAPPASAVPAASPAAAPVAPTAPPPVSWAAVMMGGAGTGGVDPTPPVPPPVDEVDAYWAMQPPEVQQLRAIPDEATRTLVAEQLEHQGFAIDPWIMVYGYDPYTIMRGRAVAGYTWVPSLSQPNIDILPGLTMAGITPYDPNSPPVGSIRVSTDFADGLANNAPV
jgi:hypothetical protein